MQTTTKELRQLKSIRMFVVGAITGALLATSVSAIGASTIQKISAYVRSDFALTVDGQPKKMQNDPVIFNDRTYIQLRELGELLDKKVDFDPKTNTIIIQKGGTDVPPKETLEDIDKAKWVYLADLRSRFNILNISQATGETIIRKGDLEFSISREERLYTGETTHHFGDQPIRLKFIAGYMHFNIDDLRAAGFIQ